MCDAGVIGSYEQSGYNRLDAKSRLLLVTTGLVAYVPETFLAGVLADNRVGLNGAEMAVEVREEYEYLQGLPWEFWLLVSEVLPQTSPVEFRNHVLEGATAAYAYLHDKVFRVSSSLPWSLCQGDVEANIAGLLTSASPPEEPVSRKLWLWGKADMDVQKLVQVVMLLGQCSWTSYVAERQHASAATLKKYHEETGGPSLCIRAFLHGFRQLLESETSEDKRVLHVKKSMRRLLQKQPRKYGARQAFFKDVMTRMQQKNSERGPDERSISQFTTMRLHAKHFAELSLEKQHEYKQKARIWGAVREEEHREQLADLERELDVLLSDQSSASGAAGSSMLFSRCRLFIAQLSWVKKLNFCQDLHVSFLTLPQ
eukprot:6492188-Amphidinium_carterae.1